MHRSRSIAILASLLLVVVFVAPVNAGGKGGGWSQPPRGYDDGWIASGSSSCTNATFTSSDSSLCLGFSVSSQPIYDGRVSYQLPAGFYVYPSGWYAISSTCSLDGDVLVSGSTVTVTHVWCGYGAGFTISVGAFVTAANGTYVVDGDYKISDAKRGWYNVYRWFDPQEVVVS